MEILVFAPFILAFILLVWFNTDAFEEYALLFKLDKRINHLAKYKHIKEQGSPTTYHEYISQYYNSFFVRLITCEICLSTWLGIIFGISIIIYFSMIYGAGGLFLSITYSLALPYFALFLYRLIRKLK